MDDRTRHDREKSVARRHARIGARIALCCAAWVAAAAACSPGAADPAQRAPAIDSVAAVAAADRVATPSRPPTFDPFPGREQVRVDALFQALRALLPQIGQAPQVRLDFERLVADPALRADQALYLDYVRVRLAFEATRAGGLWGVAWQVTDREPQSDRVWEQWQAWRDPGEAQLPPVTAIAECDELSALFAHVAHGLGLSRRSQTGLFWPTHNHTVAVWVIDAGVNERRIVVPTSQIFLDGAQSIGTRAFDPWKQKRIFDYRRNDSAAVQVLPAALARRFVHAVRAQVSSAQAQLQDVRNRRERAQWAELKRRTTG